VGTGTLTFRALCCSSPEEATLSKNPWHGKIKARKELKWLKEHGGINQSVGRLVLKWKVAGRGRQ